MKYLMIALLSLLLTACATGEKIGDLSPGMSREQVIQTLGKPDGDAVNGKNELLTYSNRLMSGWSYDRADYKVVLEDNKVVQYGADVIRQDNGMAAARALTAQQSLLIWQQQQALQNQSSSVVPRSMTTNCFKNGNNVTCNSY